MLGINQDQARSLAVGNETYIRPNQNPTFFTRREGTTSIGQMERNIMRLQHIQPSIPRKKIREAAANLAREMERTRLGGVPVNQLSPQRKQLWAQRIGELGMDPADVPEGLGT